MKESGTWPRKTRDAPLRVEDVVFLEDLGDDRNGGIDRVGDDENERLWRGGGDSRCKIPHDARVDLESRREDETGYG